MRIQERLQKRIIAIYISGPGYSIPEEFVVGIRRETVVTIIKNDAASGPEIKWLATQFGLDIKVEEFDRSVRLTINITP